MKAVAPDAPHATTAGSSSVHPVTFGNVTDRRRRRGPRRVLTVAALTVAATVPLMSTTALAGTIGERYDPDPLSAAEAWAIYGGVIVGAFLVAIALTLLSSRNSGPPRYRPGRPWQHDEVWVGDAPKVAEGERPNVALPGAGGASGNW